MATYTCLAELQGRTLCQGDCVIFEHEGYKSVAIVFDSGLGDEKGYSIDNKIFRLLGLDPWEFCKQHYSKVPVYWKELKAYYPNRWPSYCDHDYESITKVVLELFRLIEEVPKQLAETSEILFID